MPAAAILGLAIEAVNAGMQLLPAVELLSQVTARMRAEGRAEPTDADLDMLRDMIVARQRAIDEA